MEGGEACLKKTFFFFVDQVSEKRGWRGRKQAKKAPPFFNSFQLTDLVDGLADGILQLAVAGSVVGPWRRSRTSSSDNNTADCSRSCLCCSCPRSREQARGRVDRLHSLCPFALFRRGRR